MNNSHKQRRGKYKPKPKNGKSARSNKGEREEKLDNKTRSNIEYDKSDNDPAWYASNPQLLMDGFNYPFNQVPGTPIRIQPRCIALHNTDGELRVDTSEGHWNVVSPGLMVCYLRSRFETEEALNALNTAANAEYIFVNSLNSRNKSYDPNDLMIYSLAMTEVYSALVWLQRIYGLAYMYTQQSTYMPYACLRAMGINVTNLLTQLPQFREGINWLIAQIATLPVPATMSIYQRKAFLYAEVYSEGASVKDQLYMYAPASFYKFQFNQSESYGELVETYIPHYSKESGMPANSLSLDEALSYVQDLFNAIWYNQDHQTMGADILRAYGNNVIKLQPLEPNTFVVPRPDQFMVLEQLKNATIVDASLTAGRLTQDMPSNSLKFIQTLTGTNLVREYRAMLHTMPQVITTLNPSVPPELMAELTRLMTGFEIQTGPDGVLRTLRIVSGTEFIDSCFIVQRDVSNEYVLGDLVMRRLQRFIQTELWYTWNAETSSYELEQTRPFDAKTVAARTAFQYAPMSIALTQSRHQDAEGNLTLTADAPAMLAQLDNYTTIGFQDLQRMHAIALMSLLNVPNISQR